LRECQCCHNNETYIDKKRNVPVWNKTETGYLCKKCGDKQYRNDNLEKSRLYHHNWRIKNQKRLEREGHEYYLKNKEKWPDKKRVLFKNKRIKLDKNPRKGICSKCGNSGKTNLHHKKYDGNDPLANTIELCVSCHKKEHPLLRDEQGRFLSRITI